MRETLTRPELQLKHNLSATELIYMGIDSPMNFTTWLRCFLEIIYLWYYSLVSLVCPVQ